MECRLNRLDEPLFMAVSKPLLTEFGIHLRLESVNTFVLDIATVTRPEKNCKRNKMDHYLHSGYSGPVLRGWQCGGKDKLGPENLMWPGRLAIKVTIIESGVDLGSKR